MDSSDLSSILWKGALIVGVIMPTGCNMAVQHPWNQVVDVLGARCSRCVLYCMPSRWKCFKFVVYQIGVCCACICGAGHCFFTVFKVHSTYLLGSLNSMVFLLCYHRFVRVYLLSSTLCCVTLLYCALYKRKRYPWVCEECAVCWLFLSGISRLTILNDIPVLQSFSVNGSCGTLSHLAPARAISCFTVWIQSIRGQPGFHLPEVSSWMQTGLVSRSEFSIRDRPIVVVVRWALNTHNVM